MKKKPKANNAIRKHLLELEIHLEKLIGEEPGCGIEEEHKQAVKNYVKSWILPRIRIVKDWAEGEELTYRDKF